MTMKMTMSMEKLFKDLPRDLQWEILTEFVGSHSVRNGRLIKKIKFDYRHEMLLLHGTFHRPKISDDWVTDCNARAFGWLRNLSQIMFCHDLVSGEIGYLLRMRVIHSSPMEWKLEYTPMNDSVILSTFEKHYYPSYEDTDKKKKARHPSHPSLKRVSYAYTAYVCPMTWHPSGYFKSWSLTRP